MLRELSGAPAVQQESWLACAAGFVLVFFCSCFQTSRELGLLPCLQHVSIHCSTLFLLLAVMQLPAPPAFRPTAAVAPGPAYPAASPALARI